MVHGHFRHSRISRLINAKHRRGEASNGAQANPNLLGAVDTKQNPIGSPDVISEPCDPLQNITCLDDGPDTTKVMLSKREATGLPQSTHIETSLQIIDTNSQTLWQSTGVDYPITMTDPVLGILSISDSLGFSASAELLLPTPSVNLPKTQTRASATPTSPSKRPATTPSTRHPAASSSHRSSSLASSSSASPSTTRSPVTSVAHTSPTTSLTTSSSSIWSSSSSNGYGNGGTTSSTGNAHPPPTTSASQPSSGSESDSDSSTPKIIGGVIGSVAGLAMIILLLLFLLRRRNFLQRKGTEALPSNDNDARQMADRRASNDPLFSPSYFAPAFMKRWRQSTMTTATESTIDSSNASERGFQKISGRKIPPVLTHGGDGFGGGLDGDSPTVPDCLIGLSPASPRGESLSSPSYGPPPASPYGIRLDTKYTRESEELNNSPTRPQVRLPVSSSVNFGTPTTVTPSHPIAQPQCAVPSQQDGVGRSHPSYDGSRGSRFTESLEL